MHLALAGRTCEQKPLAVDRSENPAVRRRQKMAPFLSVVVIAGSRPASKDGNFACSRRHSLLAVNQR